MRVTLLTSKDYARLRRTVIARATKATCKEATTSGNEGWRGSWENWVLYWGYISGDQTTWCFISHTHMGRDSVLRGLLIEGNFTALTAI